MSKKCTNIKDRVLEFAEYKEVSKQEFFRKTGLKYSNFTGKSKQSDLNSTYIAEILLKYPNINTDWLITGKGSMIKKNSENENAQANNVFKLKTDQLVSNQQVPLYNIEASAGIVGLFNNHNETESPVDYISIPNLPKCDGALYVSGDSMYPLLKSGDIVMYKEINDIINNIFWGEMYLISIDVDGEEYVSVKWIQKSEKGEDYIKLVSQNQNHQAKDIPLGKVRALAFVKASIRVNSMI